MRAGKKSCKSLMLLCEAIDAVNGGKRLGRADVMTACPTA